ncbi:class I SAM-dependent methyltransferase [Vibrio mediterranei]|nr:class I SAM-dependent methyltransferase [Vibrio mediterranei]
MKDYDLKLLLDVESVHKKVLESIKENSKVLEIGCSKGHMTKYLSRKLKCSVVGIELDQKALQYASKYLDQGFNINIDQLDLLDQSLDDNCYDYILACDVLEHVKDAKGVLGVLKNKVKNDGQIIVSVPNASHNLILMSLLKNDFSYQDVGIFDNTHIKWFTSDSFAEIISDVGFNINRHDFTYMTPQYEPVIHNDYNKFSLFEKEVLLRHPNGHFFQNIFFLSKNKNSVVSKVQNIDSYWFDKININYKSRHIEKDIFCRIVDIDIDIDADVDMLTLNPTMRLRGVKNIKIQYENAGGFIDCEYNLSNAFELNNEFYSFSDMEVKVSIPKNVQSINFSCEYIDVDDEKLKSIFKASLKCI